MKNTKYIVLILAASAILVSPSFAQPEKQTAAIRAEVQQINAAAGEYEKKTKNIEDISTEGAEVTYYTSGKELKKVVAKIYGETGNTSSEYFYRGEDLIFAFQRSQHFDKPIDGGRVPKVVRIEELRAYFDAGKCIRLLNGKIAVKAGTIEFDEQIYAIGETAAHIKSAYDR